MAQRSISDKYIYTATLQSEWYCLRTGSVREAMSMIEIELYLGANSLVPFPPMT